MCILGSFLGVVGAGSFSGVIDVGVDIITNFFLEGTCLGSFSCLIDVDASFSGGYTRSLFIWNLFFRYDLLS